MLKWLRGMLWLSVFLVGCSRCSEKPGTPPADVAPTVEQPATGAAQGGVPASGSAEGSGVGGTVDTLLDETGGVEDLPTDDQLEIEEDSSGK